MLDDILNFGCDMLVDNARLCMWMPTANDEDIELKIPTHPAMQPVSVSVQQFNKCMYLLVAMSEHLLQQLTIVATAGARRLLTYRRLPDSDIDQEALSSRQKREYAQGSTASELNSFRRKVCHTFFHYVP